MPEHTEVRIAESVAALDAAAWNTLAGDDPFLRHEFLSALEETGCAVPETGWAPRFITLWRDGALAGALPLYLKSHSRGEYVFDWAWAEAYQRAGLRYYPKALCGVPFTPVAGSRLLAERGDDRRALLAAALDFAREAQLSSLHLLFPPEPQSRECEAAGLMLRTGVQFHWRNAGYGSFDDFLAALASAKRKKIRQERRRVAEAGIRFRWLPGAETCAADWHFFFSCYRNTYRARGMQPYLNLECFRRLAAAVPEKLLLLVAEADGEPLASALFVRNREALFGRYWGATRYVPGLHFEACYYQGIEYAIAHGLTRFEGGAQGEHKLSRGLMPVRTWSAHWLAHPEFARAVANYLRREARGVEEYIDELNESAPFRREAS
ncbi:MAG TPA: GNAT family N-acetyltransferase [Burkholderiales bacterium]|nr:GNAT family N-acetyltransferase [Burkholderiales bacterium]